jgi:hypothetical protein
VLPHLGDAYSLARWITGNRTDMKTWCGRLPARVPPSADFLATVVRGC